MISLNLDITTEEVIFELNKFIKSREELFPHTVAANPEFKALLQMGFTQGISFVISKIEKMRCEKK